jgi:hypothetical protein
VCTYYNIIKILLFQFYIYYNKLIWVDHYTTNFKLTSKRRHHCFQHFHEQLYYQDLQI